jgi:hypothetical protein
MGGLPAPLDTRGLGPGYDAPIYRRAVTKPPNMRGLGFVAADAAIDGLRPATTSPLTTQ